MSDALRTLLGRVRPVPDGSWEALRPHVRSRDLGAGDAWVHAGDPSSDVAFVLSGLLRMVYLRDDGREFNKSFLGAGDFCGVLDALTTGEPSRLTVEALEPTALVVVRWSVLSDLADTDLTWAGLARRAMEALAVKKMRREASFLLDTAEARYEAFLAEFPTLEPRLADYHIASYVGVTPEALSRIKRRRVLRKR